MFFSNLHNSLAERWIDLLEVTILLGGIRKQHNSTLNDRLQI